MMINRRRSTTCWTGITRGRVSSTADDDRSGQGQVTGQSVQVGFRYAGRVVTIEVDETMLRVFDDADEMITTVPRVNTNPAVRHKAYGHRIRNTSPEVSPLN